MLSKQVLIVFLSKCLLNIFAIHLFNNSDKINFVIIHKKVNEILQECFQNDLNPLIITEQSSKYVFSNSNQALLSSSSIIVINNEFKIQQNVRNYNPHIGTFLLTASTEDQLNKTISRLQSTPWWNTESYFLLIGPSNHSPSVNASKMLAMMWKRKILSVVYLCYDIDKEAVMLYTINPFNNYAPSPWKWVDEIKEKPDPRWNLYEHQYQGDGTICPVIMFDKTLKLDDYVISVIMDKKLRKKKVPTGVPIRLSDYRTYAPPMGISVLTEVFSMMKVKVNITDSDGLWISRDRRIHGNLQDLLDNDMYLRMRPLYHGFKHALHPYNILRLVLLGQKRPPLNTESKIFSFFHFNILIPIIFVFLTSAIILQINRQQNFTSALLKIWQLFLGSYFPQALTNTQTRIYFFGVFWLVIILNGTFQGKLASFLTKPERIYVNTIEDALKLRYHIYGARDFMTGAGYLELPAEKQKYIHFTDTFKCVDPILNDSQALCLTTPYYGTGKAKKYGLLVSPPVHQFYTVNWVSPGFSLKNRINAIIFRLKASGFMARLQKKTFYDRLDYIHARENDETKFQSRPIELYDLRFIFKVLILGHICSLIIFIIELRYHWNHTD